MATDLSIEFCGIKFKNPFLMASVPPAKGAKFQLAAQAGWAGGVLWGGHLIAPGAAVSREYLPREIKHIAKPPTFFGLFTTACFEKTIPIPSPGMAGEIKAAKASNIPVGANIIGSYELDGWVENARIAEEAGADFLELNLSCAYVTGIGLFIGKEPDRVHTIIKAIKKTCRKPVVAKLSACLIHGTLTEVAKAAEQAGADAISVSNTVPAVIGVDIETGLPIGAYIDREGNLRGMQASAYSGPAIKPLALRSVLEVAQAVKIPICAIGGINDWQSAVEFMMLGASIVQIGTGLMVYGYRMARELIDGLKSFMERKGYETLGDFIGITKKYMKTEYETPPVKLPITMMVDQSLCTGCSACIPTCEAHANSAMKMVNGLAAIDQDKCIQCNMCRVVCPHDAIKVRGWESYIS